MKITYRMTVKVKRCEDDFGLGVGVLGNQDITFNLPKHPDELSNFDKYSLYESVEEHKEKLLDDLITVQIREVNESRPRATEETEGNSEEVD